jgi:trehalose utilization protein
MKEKESTLVDLLWCCNGHEKMEQKIVEEVYKEGMHLIKLQCPTCKVIHTERIS